MLAGLHWVHSAHCSSQSGTSCWTSCCSCCGCSCGTPTMRAAWTCYRSMASPLRVHLWADRWSPYHPSVSCPSRFGSEASRRARSPCRRRLERRQMTWSFPRCDWMKCLFRQIVLRDDVWNSINRIRKFWLSVLSSTLIWKKTTVVEIL